MTIDPTPFLSTVVTVSAALVAIIDGLLVARFVSLDSDQRSSRQILAAARDRLEVAQDKGRGSMARHPPVAARRVLRRSAGHRGSRG